MASQGGFAILTADHVDPFVDALLKFGEVTDPKAALLPSWTLLQTNGTFVSPFLVSVE